MSKQFSSLDNGEIIELIKAGAVGIIPTDTVYGLVASAANPQAVAKLYALKEREHKPGTVVVTDIEQLVELGIPRRYLKAVEHFWPNPISVIIPCGQDLKYLHLGKGGLAVRIPRDRTLSQLLLKTGPLLTTSANHAGDKLADTIEEAKKYFGESVDFYVNGGDLSNHIPSTIIRIVDDAIEIIREGAVKINETGRINEI